MPDTLARVERDLLSIDDLTSEELAQLLELSEKVKTSPSDYASRLSGRSFGMLFAILTLLRVRSWLAAAISPSLKHAFAVGIGLFLALIGLYESGVVTSFVTGLPPDALSVSTAGTLMPPGAPLKLGDVRDPRALTGFLVSRVEAARTKRRAERRPAGPLTGVNLPYRRVGPRVSV
jgi:hypothetical protein